MVTLAIESQLPSPRVKVSPINFIQRIKQSQYLFPSKVTGLLLHIQNSLQQLSQAPLGTKIRLPLNTDFCKGDAERSTFIELNIYHLDKNDFTPNWKT